MPARRDCGASAGGDGGRDRPRPSGPSASPASPLCPDLGPDRAAARAHPVALPSLGGSPPIPGQIAQRAGRLPHLFWRRDLPDVRGTDRGLPLDLSRANKIRRQDGAIGRGDPGRRDLCDQAERGIAGLGETGELVHRGPLVSLSYWAKPEATAEKIRARPELAPLIGDEPVVWSGDTVRVDADGDFWSVARTDAMIKSSGFRPAPTRSRIWCAVAPCGRRGRLQGRGRRSRPSGACGADPACGLLRCRALRALPWRCRTHMLPRRSCHASGSSRCLRTARAASRTARI